MRGSLEDILDKGVFPSDLGVVSCGAVLGKLGTSDHEAPPSLQQGMRELLRGKGLSRVALGH